MGLVLYCVRLVMFLAGLVMFLVGLVMFLAGLVMFLVGLVMFLAGLVMFIVGLVMFLAGLVMFIVGLVTPFVKVWYVSCVKCLAVCAMCIISSGLISFNLIFCRIFSRGY